MKTLLHLLGLLFLPLTVMSQNTIKGTLKQSESLHPISYATISIPSLKQTTITTKEGRFELQVPDAQPYQLLVDAWGYPNYTTQVHAQENGQDIVLDEAPELLPEMFVPPAGAQPKNYTYGRTNEGSGLMIGRIMSYDKSNYDKQVQFGMIVKNKGWSTLESFHLHVRSNDYKKLTYRLSFWKVQNGMPTQPIKHEEILFSLKSGNTGWHTIDLSNKYIFIDQSIKKFAIVLTLVQLDFNSNNKEGNIDFNVGSAVNNQMTLKEDAFSPWTKFPFNIPMYVKAECYH